MGREILDLLKLDFDLRFLACSDICGLGSVNLITGTARLERIMPGFQSCGRESKATLCIGDNTDTDCRTVFLRANHHTFHQTFFGGADLPCQHCGRLTFGVNRNRGRLVENNNESADCNKQKSPGFHPLLLTMPLRIWPLLSLQWLCP